jgi:hypothetical protein
VISIDAIERLVARVKRIAISTRPTGFVGTGYFGQSKHDLSGGMSASDYDRLLARGEMQGWDPQDELELARKVRRLGN